MLDFTFVRQVSITVYDTILKSQKMGLRLAQYNQMKLLQQSSYHQVGSSVCDFLLKTLTFHLVFDNIVSFHQLCLCPRLQASALLLGNKSCDDQPHPDLVIQDLLPTLFGDRPSPHRTLCKLFHQYCLSCHPPMFYLKLLMFLMPQRSEFDYHELAHLH